MSEPTGARRYGVGGGDAYYDAVRYGGYEGTREQFGKDQAEFAKNASAVAEAKETVERDTEEVRNTKNTFENTTVPEAIRALNQEGEDQILAITQKGEEVSQQVETVGTEQKDAVANEGRARVQAVKDEGDTQVGNVNQAGEDQIDAVEQAGANQVQAVTDEGTTQIGAVTGEGNTQVQRVQDKGDEVVDSIPADYTALDQEVDNLNSQITYIGNYGTYTKAAGSSAVPFKFEKDHTYIVTNLSANGTITFKLAETPTGTALQEIYGLSAGVTKEFIANQDANYINGWQAAEQTFFIIDKSSKIVAWDNYQNQIDDIYDFKTPYTLTAGGFDDVSGGITSNQYYSYTDFIDCSLFGKLRVVSPNGSLDYCAWYKEDKTTGLRFVIAQGDVTRDVPYGYRYARLSAPTGNITGISVYTDLWFSWKDNQEYISKVKDYLPHRLVAQRSTSGTTYYRDYKVIKGHSYLVVNHNNYTVSFLPINPDGSRIEIGSTTVNANSVGMRVSEIDGYPAVYFGGDNGTVYVYDLDGESNRKTITDLNQFACDAIISSRYKTSATPHLLTLIHFSDVHGSSTALRRLINFNNDMSGNIDDAICTGDIVSSKFDDSLAFWTSSDGADKILTCVGNHDHYYTNSFDMAQLVPMATVAEKFIDPFVSNWGTVSQPTNCTYYYKDYASGYRLIVIDSILDGSDATAEATWLTNTLADAKTNGLAVIIAMHYLPTTKLHVLDCQFSKYGMAGDSGSISYQPNFACEEIVQDFINAGGKFMCYLVGHLHKDLFGHIYGYEDQPCIMVTTASPSRALLEMNADMGRDIGSKMQDAFNVVTFDKDNSIIKIIRVGADVDNVMRPRKAISYNITTGTLIQS